MQTLNEKLVEVAKDITVLYAEDNLETRTQYENIFKLIFKEVRSAENGALALEEYKTKKYDLVITDLTMPVLDGVRLISEILKIDSEQHVIIMTAHNTDENLRDSIDFQVDGILLKPVLMEKLFHLLYKVSHAIQDNRKGQTLVKENRLDSFIQDNNQALFLVVVDKLDEIIKQFGIKIQTYIYQAVREHLSYFGIEDSGSIKLNNDAIFCSVDKNYLNNILESLQEFSDRKNSIIVTFNDLKIYITLSYGVVMLDMKDKNYNSEKLINHINCVIEDIKNDENSSFVVKMDVDLEEEKKNTSLNWLGVTLHALENKTIVPFYQQIIDINTNEVKSYEIFSRIKDGDKYILPKFFIDLSKKAGILEDISKSIFKQGFEKLSTTDYSFHINLGDTELRDSSMEDYLVYISSKYNISHNKIILDITDYELLNPEGKNVKSLLRLKELGYKISLKGFASGNINIELISILEPDYIKINQILLQKSILDSNLRNALSFLLEYIKHSKIKSIIVGVEDEEILNEARILGFEYAQGFYIQKPSSLL